MKFCLIAKTPTMEAETVPIEVNIPATSKPMKI